MTTEPAIEIKPLTPERWPDLEALFGPSGAASGCWCMWFRQSNAEFERNHGEPNRLAFRALVEAGPPPGLIARVDGRPAAWVAVEPREAYSRLQRSRVTRPVDDQPCWAIPCFFVHRDFRGLGLQRRLIEAATAWAASNGARLVEAYPYDPAKGPVDDAAGFHGFISSFRACGFEEAARRSPVRPVMRRPL